jgi:uncharacterized protein (DUF433 family)
MIPGSLRPKTSFSESYMKKAHKRGKYEGRILRDPAIWSGEPVFKGTRVMLRTVLASIAAGDVPEYFLGVSPVLKQKT